MTNIIINEKKRTIEMSKKDYTSACKFGTEEYVDLQEVRRAYPDYRVIAVKSKVSGANVYKGLTYSFMEKYIMNHDDEEKTAMKEYLNMKDKAEELGAGSDAYRDIREWFIEKYPEIEEYHKEMEQKKKEHKEKREEEMEAKRKKHRNMESMEIDRVLQTLPFSQGDDLLDKPPIPKRPYRRRKSEQNS